MLARRTMQGATLHLLVLWLLAEAVGLGAAGLVAGALCGLGASVALAVGMTRQGAESLGPANAVTLARSTLVAGVAALVADSFTGGSSTWVLVALCCVALMLDAVDGQVARRTGSASPLGARFDMEVDALLILVLSAYVAHSVGWWVLAIGAARYLFVAAGLLLPWLRDPTPPRHWCKVVAAVQGVVLTVAAAGFLPSSTIMLALVGALALLAESFGRQVWWLSQHRATVATPTDRMPARVG